MATSSNSSKAQQEGYFGKIDHWKWSFWRRRFNTFSRSCESLEDTCIISQYPHYPCVFWIHCSSVALCGQEIGGRILSRDFLTFLIPFRVEDYFIYFIGHGSCPWDWKALSRQQPILLHNQDPFLPRLSNFQFFLKRSLRHSNGRRSFYKWKCCRNEFLIFASSWLVCMQCISTNTIRHQREFLFHFNANFWGKFTWFLHSSNFCKCQK